jgi:hypothetical protein
VDDGAYDDIDLEFRSDDGGDLGVVDDGGKESEARSGTPGDDDNGDWLTNGLQAPEVGGVDVAYPLNTPEGLSETFGIMTDPGTRASAEYIVECALPAGHFITKVVDGQAYVYEGQLGLAPEWETESCDEDCQQWVSACMLARTNVSGEHVVLWIQADHPGIGFGRPEGLLHEASWYGNLFVEGEEQFLCKGAKNGNVAAKRAGRTCSAGSGKQCGFTKYNDCDKHDRCTMGGPDGDVPVECKPGKKQAFSQPYRTISTYLPQ